MKWIRAIFTNFKTHSFPESIKDAMMNSLVSRGAEIYEDFPLEGGPITETDKMGINMGASCMDITSWMDFELPGAKLGFESREVSFFLHDIEGLKVRDDIGVPYYKIHGRHHCVCLLPEHRDTLLKQMRERLQEAIAIGKAEDAEFNRRLDEMQREHPKLNVAMSRRPSGGMAEG
jgi:hypothetical protein